jgi:DNA-binding CsgD family transcriptional regulator
LARRTAALEAQIKHTAPTSDVDVISAQLLKEPIEAEYFAAVDRQPGNCVKVLDDVPLRIAVLDGRTAVVPLNPHDACAGALLLDDQAAVEHVGLYLAMQVAKARPLPAAHTPELSGREFSVLRLLAQGLTDAAVARRLWICDRSVRRLIAALQRKLGVDSRFELAVEAGRRGLL